MNSLHEKYLSLLSQWVPAALNEMYSPPDCPNTLCYGTGFTHWGVQTQHKACATFAVLATDPATDASLTGISQTELQQTALQLLRFSLNTHIEGAFAGTDGKKWGHSWISVLGLERMMHGIDALTPLLTEDDAQLLERVLVSEADWLLHEHPVIAGQIDRNVPESNVWNGAFLHRVALLYPHTPHAQKYQEKGTAFLLNAVSIPEDADSDVLYDGKPLSQWHVDANFFPSFALHHHAYLNVGYMVICLSNAAMLHFAYKTRGIEPPTALYLHLKELWHVVKGLTFPDGRLARVGGDTRARYCYCQEYAIPAWLWAQDFLKDTDCAAFEQGWLAHVEKELSAQTDGSFFGTRLHALKQASPLYYTRLESDRAVTLSMGVYWHRIFPHINETSQKPSNTTFPAQVFCWKDDFHGATVHHTEQRFASVVWKAAEPPTALCLPPDKSTIAEWHQSLSGSIKGMGKVTYQSADDFYCEEFDGGFLSYGRTHMLTEDMVAEGEPNNHTCAMQDILYAALPDNSSMVVLQYARAPQRRVFLKSCKSLYLPVPNDVYNGNSRRYETAKETFSLASLEKPFGTLPLKSSWLCIDNSLSIATLDAQSELCIHRPRDRQIDLKFRPWRAHAWDGGTLYCDEICATCRTDTFSAHPGECLYDDTFLISTNCTTQEINDRIQKANRYTDREHSLNCIHVPGADGKVHFIVHNRSTKESKISLSLPWKDMNCIAGKADIASLDSEKHISVAPKNAALFTCT